MIRFKTLLIGSGLALGLGLAPASAQGWGPGACAGPGAGGPCRPGPRGMGPFLNLTPDQQTRIDAVRARHRPALDAAFRAMADARQALAELANDPAADPARIRSAYARAAEARATLDLERRAQDQECAGILTPEQRQAWTARPGRRGRGGAGCWGAGCGGY